ncbi:MAG TPA: hypothetical protein VK206_22100 [Anaerolineales bacterium]|nr:hypothetical protein [Anaerolineales bacterium]HLO34268.1 hypothetical protein [Anaerolineales bacterium]
MPWRRFSFLSLTVNGAVLFKSFAKQCGRILVKLLADEPRASKAWRMLAQVNVESRTRTREILV